MTGFFINIKWVIDMSNAWQTVYIKQCDSMRLKWNQLEINKVTEKIYVPLEDIQMIILEGKTSITTSLLSEFSKYNIVVVVCDDLYLPTGMYLSYANYHRSAKRACEQILWPQEMKALAWKSVVVQKMKNQMKYAKYKNIDASRVIAMHDFIIDTQPYDKTNREGHVAKLYFNSLYGKEFTRDLPILENAAMNYGYSIIRALMARIVVGQGFMPVLGIFHSNEYNAFNLVDDLMEPYRPLMDYWLDLTIFGKYNFMSYEVRTTIIDFINQPIYVNNQKSTIDESMKKYVNSFVKSMQNKDMKYLIEIDIDNFIGA